MTESSNITLQIIGQPSSISVSVNTKPVDLFEHTQHSRKKIVAAKFNDKVIDLHAPLTENGTLEFLTFKDPDGREVVFHSTTHLMAQAVTELFPEVKLAIGPPIDNGYYYDFDVETPFTPDDLEKIEQRMMERSNDEIPVERFEMSREDALNYYKERKQTYKVELIEDFEDDHFSFYKQGDFTDMCRGPHIPHTGHLKNFKLLHTAGAYWRGDEKRPMLQRIYGTAASSEKELKAYLKKLEEAKERDHRKLGKELDLYSIHEEAGVGLVFWHPKGSRVRNLIETFWRDVHYKQGYELVYTPHIQRENMFTKSGHLENFSENMFSPMELDSSNYYAKPMNCPGHVLIYQSDLRSYRDLPVRLAELGTVYRFERSGALHGLLRVRGFTQDDAHIFCTPDQIEEEIDRVIKLADFMMSAFGFDYKLYLSTRPEKSIGSDEIWEQSTQALRNVLDRKGKGYEVEEGGGAFYGPKIDVKLLDALDREWQGPTFQLDFNFPERFDIEYVDSDGEKKKVVMIHRTVLGSMERFFGNLIEHYKGAFPGWLAPTQVKILNISDDQIDYAKSLQSKLLQSNFRVDLDLRNEKVGFKIREAEKEKIPFMFVTGNKEMEDGTVSVRERGRKDHGVMSIDDAVKLLAKEMAIPQIEN